VVTGSRLSSYPSNKRGTCLPACGVPLSGREAGDEWVRDDRQVTPATAEQYTSHERSTAVIAAPDRPHREASTACCHRCRTPDPAHARTGGGARGVQELDQPARVVEDRPPKPWRPIRHSYRDRTQVHPSASAPQRSLDPELIASLCRNETRKSDPTHCCAGRADEARSGAQVGLRAHPPTDSCGLAYYADAIGPGLGSVS